MNRPDQYRAVMRKAGKPVTATQLSEGTGIPRPRVVADLYNIVRAGMFDVASGNDASDRTYREARVPVHEANGDDKAARHKARAERAKKTRDAKRRAAGIPTIEERNAARRAAREAREAERLQRKIDREWQQAEWMAARKAREEAKAKAMQPKLATLARHAERRSAKEQPSCAKRIIVKAREDGHVCSFEWERNGGVVERLPVAW